MPSAATRAELTSESDMPTGAVELAWMGGAEVDGRAGACDTYEPKWQPPSLWHLALLWRLLSLLLLVPLLLWLAVTRVLLSPVSMVVFVFLLVFVLDLVALVLFCVLAPKPTVVALDPC